MADPSKTTIILVPGAWHEPTCFKQLQQQLESAGYTVDPIPLASVGPKTHLKSFQPDVDLIRKAIEKAVGNSHKVLVLGHSYGGIPASQAIEGLESHVIGLFYCCSFIVPKGKSLIAAFGGSPLPWFVISDDQMEVNPATPIETFYNDLSKAQADELVKQLKPFSYQTMHTEVTYEGWRKVPTTYLYCLKDEAIPMFVQKMMVEEWAKGVDVKTETVDASHSPFLSKTEETARAVRRAAGEKI